MRSIWLTCFLLALMGGPALASSDLIHESRWSAVDAGSGLPADLTAPEGKSRWELEQLGTASNWTRLVRMDPERPGEVIVLDRHAADALRAVESRFADPARGTAAEYWLMPHREAGYLASRGGSQASLLKTHDGSTDELRVRTSRVATGWVFLPSGPREVVLERALVLRREAGAKAFTPDRLIHRWVDPGAGVVAEIWGPASSDGKRRLEVAGAAYVEETLRGPGGLRIHVDEIDHPVNSRVAYGWARASGVAVSAVEAGAHTTIGDLAAASSWDFSVNNAGNSIGEVGSVTIPMAAAESCNSGQCGFNTATKLARDDLFWDDPANADIILSVTEQETRASDVTTWLRAGVVNEGEAGALGSGESRFCFSGTEVPLWRFPHQDAAGQPYYFQNGDSWTHAPFQCENIFFNHVCPNNCGFLCPIYAAACNDHTGTQYTDVINEGPVTLPSGHTFNALLLRQVTDFCAYLGSSCGSPVDQVRTVIYFWAVPYLGTLVRLQGEQYVPDITAFTILDETDIKFGLFPPRSVSVTGTTDTTASISWDPGLDTHRIDGYKVYWGTQSGSAGAYAFNSADNPGQVSINGTTAVISGLAAGTEYFFTVTSLSDYTSPTSGVMTTFESLLFPVTVDGSPGPLPVEVAGMTTGGVCVPTEEVAGVTVSRVGSQIEVCWNASTDPCLEGYRIIASDDASSAAGWTTVSDPGLTTCQTLSSLEKFYLVLTRSSAGTGPWGHHGM